MADLKEITIAGRVLQELQKIRHEIDLLEDFVVSAMDDGAESPKVRGMIDPRTGRPFGEKKN